MRKFYAGRFGVVNQWREAQTLANSGELVAFVFADGKFLVVEPTNESVTETLSGIEFATAMRNSE